MELIIFVAVFIIGYLFWIFNKFIQARNLLKEARSGIEVQLKLRHDLIPNLVAVVSGYSGFEKSALEQITKFRNQNLQLFQKNNQATQPASTTFNFGVETELQNNLAPILAIIEAYPDLKASKNYQELFQQLVKIEDQLQNARRFYNGTIRDYNNLVQKVPSNLIALVFGFKSEEFFEIESLIQASNPQIKV